MLVNEPDAIYCSLFYCTKDGNLLKNWTAEYVLRRRKDLYDRLLSGETTLEKEVPRWLQYSAEVLTKILPNRSTASMRSTKEAPWILTRRIRSAT